MLQPALLVVVLSVLGLFSCATRHYPPGIDDPDSPINIVNHHDEFSISFSGHVVSTLIMRQLDFSSSKIKMALISANTDQHGIMIVQLYASDGSMPFRKTYMLDGNITTEEVFPLDFVPARVAVDISDYAASGFTFQIQAIH